MSIAKSPVNICSRGFLGMKKGISKIDMPFAIQNSLSLAETIAAVNRTVVARLERNAAGLATGSADCLEHLASAAIATRVLLASVAAGLAALRFVGEAFFREEFLLTRGKGEFLPAILADDDLVVVHKYLFE